MLLMFSAHPVILTLSVALAAVDCAPAGMAITVAASVPAPINAAIVRFMPIAPAQSQVTARHAHVVPCDAQVRRENYMANAAAATEACFMSILDSEAESERERVVTAVRAAARRRRARGSGVAGA